MLFWFYSDEEDDSHNSASEINLTVGKKTLQDKKQPRKMFDRFSKDAKSSGAGDLGEWEKHTKGIGAKLLFQVCQFYFVECIQTD